MFSDRPSAKNNSNAADCMPGNNCVAGNSATESVDPGAGDEFSMAQPPSAVALKLKRLKSATFKAAQNRERLPHPLFWSLFLTEVSELKKKKDEKRLIDRLVLGIGSE